MNAIIAYIREFIKALTLVAIPYLLYSAFSASFVAIYLCWIALLMATAGTFFNSVQGKVNK